MKISNFDQNYSWWFDGSQSEKKELKPYIYESLSLFEKTHIQTNKRSLINWLKEIYVN